MIRLPVRTCGWLLLLLLGSVACLPAAEAHVPPPASLQIDIEDTHVDVVVIVEKDVFRDWFGVSAAGRPLSGAPPIDLQRALEPVLERCLRVRCNGLVAAPVVQEVRAEEIEDHNKIWSYVRVRVRHALTQAPQQVSFVWQGYVAETSYVFSTMPAEIRSFGQTTQVTFREEEPEVLWHRPVDAGQRPPLVLPAPVPRPHVTLPAAALLVLALGCLVLLRLRGRLSALPLGGGAALLLIAAVVLWPVAQIDLPLPGDVAMRRPPDDKALEIFAALHRGVYHAMRAGEEGAVYDELAACVTGDLLTDLYLQIQRSLILEDQGGAVARIQKTQIDEARVLPDGEVHGQWFKVRARWRVHGEVGHWGHTHQSVNSYLANVTVLADRGRWKIGAIDIFEEVRLDDGTDGEDQR